MQRRTPDREIERAADLLPVGHFPVVFTLPAEIADVTLRCMDCRDSRS